MKNKISEKRARELLEMPLWHASQIAEFFDMKISSVRNLASKGGIPGLKKVTGKRWFVHVATFVEWFKERRPDKCKKSIKQERL